jgi:SAM-dependent methyltransferase
MAEAGVFPRHYHEGIFEMDTIDRSEGQRAFGTDPDRYHDSRPAYPERVFEILQQRCGLRAGTRTFEIGAGTGLGTRRLIELGASPVVVIEPDDRLAVFITKTLPSDSNIEVQVATFEEATLPSNWFDLGTCASAFHWVDELRSLSKITRTLKEGGWWAMWWNLFFDGSRIDEFQKATESLFNELEHSPSRGLDGRPSFALDTEARITNLRAVGGLDDIEVEILKWTSLLDTQRIRRLYATFSPISRLAAGKRERLLDDLEQVAEKQFGGAVELRITTPIYTACRRRPLEGAKTLAPNPRHSSLRSLAHSAGNLSPRYCYDSTPSPFSAFGSSGGLFRLEFSRQAPRNSTQERPELASPKCALRALSSSLK